METKALPACPVETTLTLISDKWKVGIANAQLYQERYHRHFY